MEEAVPDALGGIAAPVQVEGCRNIAKAPQPDQFREGFADFIDAVVYDDGVELVGELPWFSVFWVWRYFPVECGLPSLISVPDVNRDGALLCEVVDWVF